LSSYSGSKLMHVSLYICSQMQRRFAAWRIMGILTPERPICILNCRTLFSVYRAPLH